MAKNDKNFKCLINTFKKVKKMVKEAKLLHNI